MYTISDVYKKENLFLSYQRLVTNPESIYKDFFRDTYSTYALSCLPFLYTRLISILPVTTNCNVPAVPPDEPPQISSG